jgi:retron-type reverse transcriptase
MKASIMRLLMCIAPAVKIKPIATSGGLSLAWQQREDIRNHLINVSYQLEPVQVYGSRNGHALSRWTARDAVVLKAVANTLTPLFSTVVDSRCHHIKGNGGLKGALRATRHAITSGGYQHVVKSDIANFYASMDHDTLLTLCAKPIKDPRVLSLLNNYMNRVEVRHGDHQLIDIGVAKGCPLSPLMGALMLKSLDKMIPPGCAYARYMDDWVILTRSRHQLRRLIKNMHDVVRGLKLTLALNKTFIGRIHTGLDFLGYRFGAKGLLGLA